MAKSHNRVPLVSGAVRIYLLARFPTLLVAFPRRQQACQAGALGHVEASMIDVKDSVPAVRSAHTLKNHELILTSR